MTDKELRKLSRNVSYVRKNEESNRAKGKVESDTGRKETVSELKKTSPKDGAANS